MKRIIDETNPVLRQVAEAVVPEQITSPEVQAVIHDMKEALAAEKFGVAIAAPQIAVPLRIFVVGGKVFAAREGEEYNSTLFPDQVYINPTILKASKKMRVGDEGCLSVPGKYAPKIARSEKVTISYYDDLGEKRERGASSFLAQIFQHEIDHLNGILYIDKALEVIDVDENMHPIVIHDGK